MKILAMLLVVLTLPSFSQTASSEKPDPLASLAFLQGSWQAQGTGPSGATASGTYTFQPELDNHVLARHSRTADCKAPSSFDCEHGDLLYIFTDEPGGKLKAIYFGSEGHVLHYNVSTPTPTSAIFSTDPANPGPQFRLVYELKHGIMSGKFQMQAPGQSEWNSYLQWSGAKI